MVQVSCSNQHLADGIKPLGKLTTPSIWVITSLHKSHKEKPLKEVTNTIQPKPTAMKVSSSGPRTISKANLKGNTPPTGTCLKSNANQATKKIFFSFESESTISNSQMMGHYEGCPPNPTNLGSTVDPSYDSPELIPIQVKYATNNVTKSGTEMARHLKQQEKLKCKWLPMPLSGFHRPHYDDRKPYNLLELSWDQKHGAP